MIEKDLLNETDLVVGGNFPQENEDEYRDTAGKSRQRAQAASQAAASIAPSAEYTDDYVKGSFGTAATETFRADQRDLLKHAESHSSIAAALDGMADEVSRVKTEINDVQHTYHEQFEKMSQQNSDEGWDQSTYRSNKEKLVEAAQGQITAAADGLKKYLASAEAHISAIVDEM